MSFWIAIGAGAAIISAVAPASAPADSHKAAQAPSPACIAPVTSATTDNRQDDRLGIDSAPYTPKAGALTLKAVDMRVGQCRVMMIAPGQYLAEPMPNNGNARFFLDR